MSEWKEVRLGDISSMKYGKLSPKKKVSFNFTNKYIKNYFIANLYFVII